MESGRAPPLHDRPSSPKALTLAVARAARVPGRYADGGGGLYLNFTATGAMHWVQRIVVQGRRRDFELGSLDDVRPAAARKTGAAGGGR